MAEAAVVGIVDELTGQAVNAFVALKTSDESNDAVHKALVLQVRKSIGPFAAPKRIFVVDDLPKTRSGKIMRRILRKILSGEEDSLGDTSTVSPIDLPSAEGPPRANRLLLYSSCLIQVWWKRLSMSFANHGRHERVVCSGEWKEMPRSEAVLSEGPKDRGKVRSGQVP